MSVCLSSILRDFFHIDFGVFLSFSGDSRQFVGYIY